MTTTKGTQKPVVRTKRANTRGKRASRSPAANVSAVPSSANTASEVEITREQMIAEAAYYRAQERGFTPGRELDDWLAAEAEITTIAGIGREPGAAELH